MLTDSSNLFVDAGIGCWAYRSRWHQGLTSVIPTLEIHQNIPLQEGDMVSAGPFQVGDFQGTTSLTNLGAGTTFEFSQRLQLSVAYTTPIGGGADRQYDGGLQVFLSHPLGR